MLPPPPLFRSVWTVSVCLPARRQNVEVKKVSTKHILRSTLVGTPKPPRRRLLPQERYARRRTSSLPDLFKPHEAGQAGQAGAIAALAQAHHSYFNTIHAVSVQPSEATPGPRPAPTRTPTLPTAVMLPGHHPSALPAGLRLRVG